jgi:hypothetical protein
MNHSEIRNTVFPKALKLVLSISFVISSAQEKTEVMNGSLDNYIFNSQYNDSINFVTKIFFPLQSLEKLKKTGNTVLRDGLPYIQESYTEYLPDGRKLYRKTNDDVHSTIEKFHYKNNLLVLKESVENKNTNSYNWLFYNKENHLQEEIDYMIDDKKSFVYEGYTKYSYSSEPKRQSLRLLTTVMIL